MYKKLNLIIILISSFILAEPRKGSSMLNKDLLVFNSLIGKNYIGKIQNKTGNQLITETVFWESALKGDAVRVTHSFNQDELLGETLIMYDQLEDDISCWYFSSGGISRKSKFLSKSNEIIFLEDVSRNKNSITKIRTKYELNTVNTYEKVTQYLINNVWTKGERVLYEIF